MASFWIQNLVAGYQSYLGRSREALSTSVVSLILAVGLAAFVVVLCNRHLRRALPPGPRGYPLIGAIRDISGDIHLDVMRLGLTYGDVISLPIGPQVVIFLNSRRAIKEVFVDKSASFAIRSCSQLSAYMGVYHDIFYSQYDGAHGKRARNRHFLLNILRHFGLARAAVHDEIQDAVSQLLQYLSEHSGESFHISELLPKFYGVVCLRILFKKTYAFEDAKLTSWIRILNAWHQSSFGDALVVDVLPWWIGEMLYKNVTRDLKQRTEAIRTSLENEMKDPKDAYDCTNASDRMVSETDIEKMNIDILSCLIVNFLPDLVDTIASMDWLVLYLTKYQDVQTRIHTAIDQVVDAGEDGACVWSDAPRLPYVEAAMLEAIRLGSPAVMTAAHSPGRDTRLACGYCIPKDTPVFANLYAARRDPAVYEEPDMFRPERFLDAAGNLVQDEEVIPFCMGGGICEGDRLVKMELFLVATNLLRKFRLSFPDDEMDPTLEPLAGCAVRLPRPYRIVATPR